MPKMTANSLSLCHGGKMRKRKVYVTFYDDMYLWVTITEFKHGGPINRGYKPGKLSCRRLERLLLVHQPEYVNFSMHHMSSTWDFSGGERLPQ